MFTRSCLTKAEWIALWMSGRTEETKAKNPTEKYLVLKASSEGKLRICQHNCTGKIKAQETQTEHIYNTSNNKSIKESLARWTMNLPLQCCQINQSRANCRKAVYQVLVTRD